MDVKTRSLFYSTAGIICGLFCLLCAQIAQAEPAKSAVLHPQGLLWKIEKKDHPVSYLFGTIHIGDQRVLELLDILQKPLKASELFAMEVVLDETAQHSIAKASFFSQNLLLQDFIDDILLDQINIIMHQYYGIGAEVVNKMKPWAVMATISSPPAESNAAVLDIELQNMAQEYAHPVVGLETIEEQIEALSGMDLSDQLWMLKKVVRDFEKNTGLWEELVASYLRRDLQALLQSQDAMMDDSSNIDDRFMEKLLDQRNTKMAARLISMLPKKSVFAAIGALHLPGKKGVLHLLEQAGYEVTPVY